MPLSTAAALTWPGASEHVSHSQTDFVLAALKLKAGAARHSANRQPGARLSDFTCQLNC